MLTAGRLRRFSKGELIDRMKSWWYGVDRRELAAPEVEVEAARGPSILLPGQAPVVDDVGLREELWGEGCLLPGNTDYLLELVKPFGITPAMSVLDLTVGLGGPSRQLSRNTGVYITGLERSAEIARRGQAMSVKAGFARKVAIAPYDPDALELRLRAFDCIYAQHLTATLNDKERLMREVMRGLKPRGQFAFVDFVMRDGKADDPALTRLLQAEPRPMSLWRAPQYVDCLSNAGFDCRICEDQSELYRSLILAGWQNLIGTRNLRAMTNRHLLALLDEADLWMRRVKAIEQGALAVYRFYAISTFSNVG